MSEREKQIAENLVDAFTKLPDNKKEFLLGYAEGVAAMTERGREKEASDDTERPQKEH